MKAKQLWIEHVMAKPKHDNTHCRNCLLYEQCPEPHSNCQFKPTPTIQRLIQKTNEATV